ncbi:MAG: phosphotransferase [Actinomycetota bacterium]
MDELTIPASIADVDAGWMATALGQPITAVAHEQIGEGIGVSSAVYRSALTGGELDSVVVKLPALAEEAVFTSAVLRMYIREVRFFQNLASQSPIRVPAGYVGLVDEETSQFVQVMEDMGAMRMVDQNEGMSIDDAKQAVDELAKWHAAFWGQADGPVERGDVVCLGDPVYPAVLPMVFAEGWEKVNAEMNVDPVIGAVGPGWTDWMPTALERLSGAPNTIAHGDYRADNILFDDDGNVVLLDFQLTGRGSASYDLAYFITQSLAPDLAATHETGLFNRWLDGLIAAGVPESETTALWDRYRDAALFCLVYPIVASRGMDLSDERQYALVDNMNTRFVRAVDQLNLADLLSA